MRLAVVTCREIPERDFDEPILLKAARARGWEVTLAAWEDSTIDWTQFDTVVVRSTWNYFVFPYEFYRWLERVDKVTCLVNPLALMRDNISKDYLLDLEKTGIPIVPTRIFGPGDAWPEITEKCVVKPTISAGSWHTYMLSPGDAIPERFRDCRWMLQPFISSVAEGGEISVISIGGRLSHAVQKWPRFAGQDERTEPYALDDELRDIAQRVLATIEGSPAYARVDVMRHDGQWLLSELELIEPSLFFFHHEPAVESFLDALA